MKAIFKREMHSYFTSPIGYVFLGVFMILSGIFFGRSMFVNRIGSAGDVLPVCMVILMLLVPIITMRLFAEEKANKTDQLLLTAPIKVSEIVLGKFFAALTVFAISVLTTFPYIIVCAIWGDVAIGETVSAYTGYLLFASLLISMGLFLSCLTENQIVAAVLTYGVTLMLFFSSLLNTNIAFIDSILKYFDISGWNESFSRGVITPSGVVYYLSFTVLFLILSSRQIESRRWK
ncbi:MAG: ABC transporter permease [Clostridia bacterium]